MAEERGLSLEDQILNDPGFAPFLPPTESSLVHKDHEKQQKLTLEQQILSNPDFKDLLDALLVRPAEKPADEPVILTPPATLEEPPPSPIAVPVREKTADTDTPHGPSTNEGLQKRINQIGRELKQLKGASVTTRRKLTTQLNRLTTQVGKQVEQAVESGLSVKQQAKTKATGELKSVQDRINRQTKRLSQIPVSDTAMWQKIGTEIVKLTNQELKLLKKLRPNVKFPPLPHPSKTLMRNAGLATAALAMVGAVVKYKPEDFPPPVSLPDVKPPALTLPNIPPPDLSFPKFNIPPPQTKQVRVGIASAAEEPTAPENPSAILPTAVSSPPPPPSPTLIANSGEPAEEEGREEVKAEIPSREERILYPRELSYNEVEKRLDKLQNSTDVGLTESLFTKEIAGLTSDRREMVLRAIAAAHAQALIEHYGDTEAIIGLDPGHGGSDVGSSGVTPAGKLLAEKDLTWQLSQLIAEEIYQQSKGKYIVVFLRPPNPQDEDLDKDGHITPVERLQKRKALLLAMEEILRPDSKDRGKNIAYISAHFNGSPDQNQNGTETYWPNSTGMSSTEYRASSKELALKLHREILNAIRQVGYPAFDRGAKEDPDMRVSRANSERTLGPYVVLGGKLPRNLRLGEGR